MVARRAGVSAPHQRARTAMERRPYPVSRVGCACGCRMVDVAEAGVRRGGDEQTENLACGAETLRSESPWRRIREVWRNRVCVHVARWDYGADARQLASDATCRNGRARRGRVACVHRAGALCRLENAAHMGRVRGACGLGVLGFNI